MEQINVGAIDVVNASARDFCALCDAQTEVIIRPNDVCTCCDSTDWFEKDE